ncbi:neuronal acetylcholine receptor subunit alpha-2-like [Paramacrobiotus metropolitanus]|uniref:neuronal acetylcholine receptor subunit alpha-2-like n=1 Tax=Paramacrobiotus metropolitanus TaxID=2943436 RepID=UPI002445F3B2|nr:neuronal acetylcholine receptor subunit alpha-2-like [Paramacrobiotus metropolitanus]
MLITNSVNNNILRMYINNIIIFLCCSAVVIHHTSARSVMTSVLVQHLMDSDSVHVQPNADQQGQPVVVKIGLSVTGIQHERPESNSVKVHGFLKLEWKNSRLAWEPLEYNNITVARVPSDHVWLPDITLFNNFDARSRVFSEEKKLVLVMSDGSVIWVPPVTFPISCNSTETRADGGELNCFIKLGSWTYDETLIDVQADSDKIDDLYLGSSYRITDSKVVRNSAVYPCCKEAYPSIDITFTAKRV